MYPAMPATDSLVSSAAPNEAIDQLLKQIDADRLATKQQQIVSATHKTVDTFAGIVGRKLWCVDGPTPQTDGHQITVPLKNQHVYQYAEHELAHVLFDSNLKAKTAFADGYAEQIEKAMKAGGVPLSNEGRGTLLQFLHLLVNVVEDHRVNSLWAMLYPGSYTQIREIGQELLRTAAKKKDKDLLTFMLVLAYDLDMPPCKHDRLRPIVVAALKRVERKGPGATFIVSKWLVSQMVTEIIRSLRGLPPPPSAGSATIETAQLKDPSLPQSGAGESTEGSGTGDSDEGDDEGEQDSGSEGADSEDSEDGDDSEGSNAAGAAGAGGVTGAPRQPEWQAQQVDATTAERTKAFAEIVASAKDFQPSSKVSALTEWLDNMKTGKYPNPAKDREGEQMARAALETSVADTDKVDVMLARSEGKMQERIAEIQKQIEEERERDQDEWILRDAGAKVTLRDIPLTSQARIQSEDRETVTRLKGIFQRVKTRRKKRLYDAGTEVDVGAYIANQMNRTCEPMFKDEGNGRGFKCLVLVDRSGSMQGRRTEQVERATQILRRSLQMPNVEFHVWGFQTGGAGEGVLLTRIPNGADLVTSPNTPVQGATPMHVAIKTAVNWLQDGTEKKQLVVLTDGLPNHSSSKGNAYSATTLMAEIGNQVKRARKWGVNVTGIAVGSEVTSKAMQEMFGERRNWTRLREDRMSADMISVVTSSFQRYLSEG